MIDNFKDVLRGKHQDAKNTDQEIDYYARKKKELNLDIEMLDALIGENPLAWILGRHNAEAKEVILNDKEKEIINKILNNLKEYRSDKSADDLEKEGCSGYRLKDWADKRDKIYRCGCDKCGRGPVFIIGLCGCISLRYKIFTLCICCHAIHLTEE